MVLSILVCPSECRTVRKFPFLLDFSDFRRAHKTRATVIPGRQVEAAGSSHFGPVSKMPLIQYQGLQATELGNFTRKVAL